MNLYLHFLLFLDTEMSRLGQILLILPCLLMTWRRKGPGQKQPGYWQVIPGYSDLTTPRVNNNNTDPVNNDKLSILIKTIVTVLHIIMILMTMMMTYDNDNNDKDNNGNHSYDSNDDNNDSDNDNVMVMMTIIKIMIIITTITRTKKIMT